MELECFVKVLLAQIWWRENSLDQCSVVVEDLLNKCTIANRRSLDQYTASLYHYWARIEEKRGKDEENREQLLEALNRACVRTDETGQCVLLNLLLRNYLRHNQLEAAYNLI